MKLHVMGIVFNALCAWLGRDFESTFNFTSEPTEVKLKMKSGPMVQDNTILVEANGEKYRLTIEKV